MRLNAYVLAADPTDPTLIEASVLSYYNAVDRIFVSYGESGSAEALRRLRAIDGGRKLVLCPDRCVSETEQRQAVLDEASDGADWVLQIDTDEVVADLLAFLGALTEANRRGFGALEYPARNFYRPVGGANFLECCRSGWRLAARYAGPVAVRAGTTLRWRRECDASAYRVDFSHRNTDPAQPKDAPVHRVVDPVEAIYRYSALRGMASTHPLDAGRALRDWDRCGRHPLLAVAAGPVRQLIVRGAPTWLRLSKGHRDAPGASPEWTPQFSHHDG